MKPEVRKITQSEAEELIRQNRPNLKVRPIKFDAWSFEGKLIKTTSI